MCARWPSSLCSLLLWTCLTACSGSISSDGRTRDASAADGGQDAATDPDAGNTYQGDGGEPVEDAGAADAAQGGTGGPSGVSSELEDVAPAECRPDPTDFTACGGDVTGEWRVSSLCLDAEVEDLRERLMCSELTQDFTSEYRMLIEFASSGNYTAAVHASAVQTVLLPYSCVPEEAEGDCKAVVGDDTDDSDGQTVTVTMDDEGCVIEAHEQKAISEAGTWEVSGDEITMTNAIGPRTSEYCVSGDSLIMKSVNTATNEVFWGVYERL
jgi:hypothetical protein